MNRIEELFGGVESVAILGHIRPDGDCVGACLGMMNYLKLAAPTVKVQVYLEDFPESFRFLKGSESVSQDPLDGTVYDLCLALDASDKERLGRFHRYFDSAKKTACIDHHITNAGYADVMHVEPEASATCEVLCGVFDDALVNKDIAECLYMGIVHDTGVFKHSNTTRRTMEFAGRLLEKGVSSSEIIDRTFYEKTYLQNQILGRMLAESVLFMDGRCIFSVMRLRMAEFYGASPKDFDGIIDQLRVTKGVECAIFLYETEPGVFKVSMRSNSVVNVSEIAAYFGGGGHIRAAGCTMSGSSYDVINNLSVHIEAQLQNAGLN